MQRPRKAEPDLGGLMVVLLVGTLAGLRDRLDADGFAKAAGLMVELVFGERRNCAAPG